MQTEPVSFCLQDYSKLYHGMAFPIPHVHLETLKKEVQRLVKLGVLRKQPSSEWVAPIIFIIPRKKKNSTFCVSNFWEVNKHIICTPYPILKSSTMPQEMDRFTCTTSTYLNMGHYTIRLDPTAPKFAQYFYLGVHICICTFQWALQAGHIFSERKCLV